MKYGKKEITYPRKNVPTLWKIWTRIDKLGLGPNFKTDALKRLYDWESKVLHRRYRTDEYVLWFIYYYTATEIMAAFTDNLKHYGDDILDELQKDGIIKIRQLLN